MNPPVKRFRPQGATRIGRIATWQRRASYYILATCATTGLVWFACVDGLGMTPPQLVWWWKGHGVSGILTLLVVGAVLPHHVTATWRHHRNRWLGGATLAAMALLSATAMALLYGNEPWHDTNRWLHIGLGILAVVVFPWHVMVGRLSVGKPAQRP